MAMLTPRIKRTVTAFALMVALTTPLSAQETDLDGLFQDLIEADETTHARIADRIRGRFEKSGSPSMDLLLRRGSEAAEEGEFEIAIEHFSALVDHAPDFAEGYHSRASAFFSTGQIGLAIDDLRQTLALNPRHFEAMFGVGIILEELGRVDDAVKAYEAIQEIYPLDPEAAQALSRLETQTTGQRI